MTNEWKYVWTCIVDGWRHEKARGAVFAVTLVVLSALCLAGLGCSVPNDGIAGASYCGEQKPLSFTVCPCTHKLSCTSEGCLCLAPDITEGGTP